MKYECLLLIYEYLTRHVSTSCIKTLESHWKKLFNVVDSRNADLKTNKDQEECLPEKRVQWPYYFVYRLPYRLLPHPNSFDRYRAHSYPVSLTQHRHVLMCL